MPKKQIPKWKLSAPPTFCIRNLWNWYFLAIFCTKNFGAYRADNTSFRKCRAGALIWEYMIYPHNLGYMWCCTIKLLTQATQTCYVQNNLVYWKCLTYRIIIILIVGLICSFCNAQHINPLGSQGTAVWQLQRTHSNSTSGRQAGFHTHNERPETMDQKYERIQVLGVGGNRSARKIPTKVGMESANQIHIQPLASCIGERKVFEH